MMPHERPGRGTRGDLLGEIRQLKEKVRKLEENASETHGKTEGLAEGIAAALGRMVPGLGGLIQSASQRPEFHEYSVVLKGMLRVEHDAGSIDVHAGQAVIAAPGEAVRYSTPLAEGAEYIAVCLPAFSPGSVHREE